VLCAVAGIAILGCGFFAGKYFFSVKKDNPSAGSTAEVRPDTTAASDTTTASETTVTTVATTTVAATTSTTTSSTTATTTTTSSTVATTQETLSIPKNPKCLNYEGPNECSYVVYSWDSVPGASGYELSIYYSMPWGEVSDTTNTFEVYSLKYVEKGGSMTVTSHCKVRAFKSVNGNRLYSQWSNEFTSPDHTIPAYNHADLCERYGQINTHGARTVNGYTALYVAHDVPIELERDDLQNGWHIVAYWYLDSKGVRWYELYDADDGDYYGWVDSTYLDFYS
jgi:hypothetical protein